ncbi:MAG: hypothetical protein P1V19_07675 [Gimesia sp.]|nr:hypothetical protein [Gimesia sp.]
MKDGSDRAFDAARVAVNALVRIDVEHLVAFVEAVAGTNDDTVCVLAARAWGGYDVGHSGYFLK